MEMRSKGKIGGIFDRPLGRAILDLLMFTGLVLMVAAIFLGMTVLAASTNLMYAGGLGFLGLDLCMIAHIYKSLYVNKERTALLVRFHLEVIGRVILAPTSPAWLLFVIPGLVLKMPVMELQILLNVGMFGTVVGVFYWLAAMLYAKIRLEEMNTE